jgi:hypothetical protein
MQKIVIVVRSNVTLGSRVHKQAGQMRSNDLSIAHSLQATSHSPFLKQKRNTGVLEYIIVPVKKVAAT